MYTMRTLLGKLKTNFGVQLSPELICVELELMEEYPVTNLHPWLHIHLSSVLAPEHHNTTALPLPPPLLERDTCSVCGSHACRHCPSLSSSSSSGAAPGRVGVTFGVGLVWFGLAGWIIRTMGSISAGC